ncbi:hypothetical protein [Cognaticolwellia mytili]|uniref:hypothetical protein n=1 Tax=Cognaticolwellia mytili TaxID=1888913 RepID=UPI000A16D903|nr:hypothetical protein [Cognaticolwellia mytili]
MVIYTVDWQAFSSICTLCAVIIALYPIFRSYFNDRAKAKTLRARIKSKLTRLEPNISEIKGLRVETYKLLDNDGLKKMLAEFEDIAKEIYILKPDEQSLFIEIISTFELIIPIAQVRDFKKIPIDAFSMIVEQLKLLFGTNDMHSLEKYEIIKK